MDSLIRFCFSSAVMSLSKEEAIEPVNAFPLAVNETTEAWIRGSNGPQKQEMHLRHHGNRQGTPSKTKATLIGAFNHGIQHSLSVCRATKTSRSIKLLGNYFIDQHLFFSVCCHFHRPHFKLNCICDPGSVLINTALASMNRLKMYPNSA